jgi:hypothetical protein
VSDTPEPLKWLLWTFAWSFLSVVADGTWWQAWTLFLLAGSGGTWAQENQKWHYRKRQQ